MKITDLININKLKPSFGKRTIEAAKQAYDNMYDVCDVYKGYNYWRKMLTAKTIGMFEYDGLPDTIPASAFEMLLIEKGKCAIVRHNGELYAVPLSENGVGYYPLYPPSGQWTTTLIDGHGNAYKDYCPIYANAMRLSLNDTISRYARLLADVESTLSSVLYTMRKPQYATADDEITAESYQAAQIANRLGYNSVVFDNKLMSNISMLPVVDALNPQQLTELVAARENTLRAYMSELGIQYTTDKREYVSVEQVKASNQMLIINVSDMLNERKNSLDKLNKMYNINVSVRLNPAYDILTMVERGDKDNDDNTVSDDITT